MISIIIIVKNDRRIEKLLDKLKHIPKPEKTEIIVIDASKKETLLDIKKKFPEARWFYYKNKSGKKITIPEQRNMGIKKSKGDIIVFVDADCIPSKNWLIELTKPLRNKQENMVIGYIKVKGGEDLNNSRENYVGSGGNGNMSYTRKLVEKVGYYDEKFSISEDRDFCIRARDANYKIRFLKSAIVFHSKDNFKKLFKNSFIHGKSTLKIYKKHFKKIRKKYFLDKRIIYDLVYPLYLLLLPLAFVCPYYLLFILIPLIKNIRKEPLKKVFLGLVYGVGFLKELFFPGEI